MATITIPRKEYQELIEKGLRYEYLREVMREDIFGLPPTRDMKEVMGAFKSVRKYNAKFLKSLEKGLRRSSYFRA